MNSYILFKRGILVALVAIFFAGGVGMFDSVESADLTAAKVELDTPRFSFHGQLAAGNVEGSPLVTLANTGAPSTGTYNLFVGETVSINSNTYEVIDADDGQTFQIDPGLLLADIGAGEDVYVARPTTMTVSFATVSDLPGGKFIVKVPANATTPADGIPDSDGWDAQGITSNCASTSAPAVLTTAGGYHEFECVYPGSTPASEILTITGIINPSPSVSPAHTVGLSDQQRIIIQHLDASDAVIDQSTAAVALIEAVRITASVAPSIELQLLGVNSSTAACGETTSETTASTEVPLGELSIQNFTTAAQQLKVSTNAQNGYVVTAIAEDQLRRQHVAACTGDGDAVSGCIPDSAGDGSGMTKDLSDEWSSTDTKGFAYSLEDVTSGGVGTPTMSFETGSNSQYRQFADAQELEDPVILFSSDTVADSHLVNVCYKAVISATQEAGEDYATNVTYRATATF